MDIEQIVSKAVIIFAHCAMVAFLYYFSKISIRTKRKDKTEPASGFEKIISYLAVVTGTGLLALMFYQENSWVLSYLIVACITIISGVAKAFSEDAVMTENDRLRIKFELGDSKH
jgi:formate hydrogenlyase subunit 3/multisubunit Na+/H+ antiporter MnhD subunit